MEEYTSTPLNVSNGANPIPSPVVYSTQERNEYMISFAQYVVKKRLNQKFPNQWWEDEFDDFIKMYES